MGIKVMELEFEGDAAVEVYTPSILTKGIDPAADIDADSGIRCKEEPAEDNSMADDENIFMSTRDTVLETRGVIGTGGLSDAAIRGASDSSRVNMTEASPTFPDTDDGF